MIAETPPAEGTRELLRRLRNRFAWPEYVLLEEIEIGTDGIRSRRADAIAVGQWHSSGYGLQGFEVKATRADWLREVRTIGKADPAYMKCSRFWLVAPEGVATIDELPGTWGWMIPRGETLRVKRQAPVLQPEPLSKRDVAHLLGTCVRRGSRDDDARQREHDAYTRGVEAGKEAESRRWSRDELEQLRLSVDRFEKASGVKVDSYDGAEIGKAVRFVKNGGLRRKEERIGELAQGLIHALAAIADVMPEVKDRYSAKAYPLRKVLEEMGIEDRGW